MHNKANLVYQTADEYTSGPIFIDKLLSCDEFHYRLIAKDHNNIPIKYTRIQTFPTIHDVYTRMRTYFGCSIGGIYYDIYTTTVVRYTDDTFTIPMDIPLDDPIVHMCRHYHSDEMRKMVM